jgi:hypothetical protein
LEGAGFAGEDEWGEGGEDSGGSAEGVGVGPAGLLGGGAGTPGVRRPRRGHRLTVVEVQGMAYRAGKLGVCPNCNCWGGWGGHD